MQSYPSISTATGMDRAAIYHVFDKRDGSNVRAEWTPKNGLCKFGSRTQLLSSQQTALWPARDLILAHEDALGRVLRAQKWVRATMFFEYEGPQSFAGSHHDDVEAMRVVLLDIHVYGQGLLEPDKVINLGQQAGVAMASLLHHGRVDQDMLDAIRAGQFPGVSFEGVVGKGAFSRKLGHPVMFKHKTAAWLNQLRTLCGGDEALFHRLA